MLHGIINEQGHLFDERDDVLGNKCISYVFLKVSSLWCLKLRH